MWQKIGVVKELVTDQMRNAAANFNVQKKAVNGDANLQGERIVKETGKHVEERTNVVKARNVTAAGSVKRERMNVEPKEILVITTIDAAKIKD